MDTMRNWQFIAEAMLPQTFGSYEPSGFIKHSFSYLEAEK